MGDRRLPFMEARSRRWRTWRRARRSGPSTRLRGARRSRGRSADRRCAGDLQDRVSEMSSLLETIRSAGEPFGLNLIAAVPVARYDAVVTQPYRAAALDVKAKSIVVIANGGG